MFVAHWVANKIILLVQLSSSCPSRQSHFPCVLVEWYMYIVKFHIFAMKAWAIKNARTNQTVGRLSHVKMDHLLHQDSLRQCTNQS